MPRVRSVVISAGAVAVGLSLTAGGARELLRRQAAIARRAIGKPLGEEAPYADRTWKASYGDRMDLLMLGDSIAAGLGAERRKDTLGARLARGLAKHLHRAVRLRTAAIVGSESSALGQQIDSLPHDYVPDVAVIVIGGNDVTHRVPVAKSVAHLEEAIRRLRARGAQVVVGTCPDLRAIRPVPQPLRTIGSRLSRQLAAAQARAAVAGGAHAVSLAHVVGPLFVDEPDQMFSTDRFHPSALGYKRTAKALLPSVLTALGMQDEAPYGHLVPDSLPDPAAGFVVEPVAEPAEDAGEGPGG
ncbi:MAG: SGNH/GDSL hydrolase family protein [Nocardioidaceae bacterium]|nr:SGNH/GDSL hydrolase family protein [Nocardioidaceae bacterium]MCL2612807.1 SGNH/GDSL hydrolase family protein [Nocardioidaceae bacterium]